MEDLKVHYDYSVRSSSGSILQFVYGDDGMDSIYVESQPLIVTKLNIKKEGGKENMTDKFAMDESINWVKYMTKKCTAKMKRLKNYQTILEDNFKTILEHRDYIINKIFRGEPENNISYPVHIQRIITNICGISKKNHKQLSNISPIDIIKGNDKLKNKLIVTPISQYSITIYAN